MFNRILIPLDGSILAEQVIPHAVHFARIFMSEIILLQVLDPSASHENPETVYPLSWQIRKAETESYLASKAEQIRAELGEEAQPEAQDLKSRVSFVVLEGKIPENIIDYAHAENIDLVVIGTHGAGGLSRWTMSSITQKVINLVYLNVLLVRTYLPTRMDYRVHYHRILLPIDSSRRAESTLAVGIAIAQGEQSYDAAAEAEHRQVELVANPTIFLAAVLREPEIYVRKPYPARVSQLAARLMEVNRNAVTQYLDELKKRVPLETEMLVVDSDQVLSAIQEMADQQDVDLVVLCAHGYSGRLTPYGAVTREYMEHGTKPILIIQDIPLSEVKPTAAEIAAGEVGKR
ncbi:MAG: universal stress protein [Anaerolineae bacterium]